MHIQLYTPHLKKKFLSLLQNKNTTPIVIYGQPGSGKTTFIMKMLEENNIKPVHLDSLPFYPKYLAQNEIGYYDTDTPVKVQCNLIIETRSFFYPDSFVFSLNERLLKKYSFNKNMHSNSLIKTQENENNINLLDKKIETLGKLSFDNKFTMLNRLFYKNISINIPKLTAYIHNCYLDFMNLQDSYEVISDLSLLFSSHHTSLDESFIVESVRIRNKKRKGFYGFKPSKYFES
ncbi:hypothetical protein H311_01010 [Anncaliia algerae PRA109]|nr:hypothetical protein H311_01010 [Anncaliia algerae PRA109]